MATRVADGSRLMISQHEAALAGRVVQELAGPTGELIVEREGERIDALPPEVGRLIQEVLTVLARGDTVTIGSLPQELTTTTAAAVLSISRPTLMAMIKDGAIPAHKVGSHTRLLTEDVLASRAARRARERAAFAQLRDLDD